MAHLTSVAPTVLASFMASLVEFVEALTIVLAVGVVRGWRSALLGTAAALASLLALVMVLGPSLARIPLHVAQLAVGTLLLLFGLRWLRKAVLRSAGVLALHDESLAFEKERESLRRLGAAGGGALDRVAFAASFKIVMLEGIEVVFIVIAIGAGGPLIVPAATGAALALLVVASLGLVLHRPLASVPENTLKLGVGVLLSAFGCFWVGEGIGLAWPGGDLSVLALIAAYLAIAIALVPVCTRARRTNAAKPKATPRAVKPSPSLAASIAAELWGLFVDDAWLAAGVVAWVAATAAMQSIAVIPVATSCVLFAAGFNALLAASAFRRAGA